MSASSAPPGHPRHLLFLLRGLLWRWGVVGVQPKHGATYYYYYFPYSLALYTPGAITTNKRVTIDICREVLTVQASSK